MSCLPDLEYIADFVSPTEEELLIKQIHAAPKTKWTYVTGRRLQNWGGLPHPNGMVAESIPPWLGSVMDRVSDRRIFGVHRANHALVNEYLPGQGIMPHHDGPLYYPCVSIISLNSHTIMDFHDPIEADQINANFNDRYKFSVYLEPRSLLVFRGSNFDHLMHSIAERDVDRLSGADIPNIVNFSSTQLAHSFANELCASFSVVTVPRQTRISITVRHVPFVKRFKLKL